MSEAIAIKHDPQVVSWANSPERVPVFSVERPNPEHADWEADDERDLNAEPEAVVTVDFTMPARPNRGLSLDYLRRARVSSDLAASWLLEQALGEEGYDALVEELGNETDEKKADDILNGVIAFVSKRVMGSLAGKAR